MGRFRFSLAGMAGVFFLLCVHLAAWISRWPVSGAISATMLFALTGLAVCGAICCRDDRRPFWTGVAVFGIIFCYTSLHDSSSSQYSMTSRLYGYGPSTAEPGEMESLLNLIEVQMGTGFREGDHVSAVWQGSSWYPGVIITDNHDGTYIVKWDDGSAPSMTSQLRFLPWRSRTAGRGFVGTLFAFAGGVACALLFGPKKDTKGAGASEPAKQAADVSHAANP